MKLVLAEDLMLSSPLIPLQEGDLISASNRNPTLSPHTHTEKKKARKV